MSRKSKVDKPILGKAGIPCPLRKDCMRNTYCIATTTGYNDEQFLKGECASFIKIL